MKLGAELGFIVAMPAVSSQSGIRFILYIYIPHIRVELEHGRLMGGMRGLRKWCEFCQS